MVEDINQCSSEVQSVHILSWNERHVECSSVAGLSSREFFNQDFLWVVVGTLNRTVCLKYSRYILKTVAPFADYSL